MKKMIDRGGGPAVQMNSRYEGRLGIRNSIETPTDRPTRLSPRSHAKKFSIESKYVVFSMQNVNKHPNNRSSKLNLKNLKLPISEHF